MYCIIDHFEGGLLVIVIYSTVSMEDGHALLFGPFAVAPVHTVIGPVVPLAGKDEETLWKKNNTQEHIIIALYYTKHYDTVRTVRFVCDW